MDKPGVIAQAVLGFRQAQRSLNQAGQLTLVLGEAAAIGGLLDTLTALPGAAVFAPLKASSRLKTGVAEAEQASQMADRAAQAQFIDDLLQGARRMGVMTAGIAGGPTGKPKAMSPVKRLDAQFAAQGLAAPREAGGASAGGGFLGALRDVALQEAASGVLSSLKRAHAHAPQAPAVGGAAVGSDPTTHNMSDLLASLTAQLAGQAASGSGADLVDDLLGARAGAPLRAALQSPFGAPSSASGAVPSSAQLTNAGHHSLSQLVQDASGAARGPGAISGAGGAVAPAGQASPSQDPTSALLGMTLLTHMVSDWWPMTLAVNTSMGALDSAAGALTGALQLPYRSASGAAQVASAHPTAPRNASPRGTSARASSVLKPQRAAPADTLAALRLNESANDGSAPAASPGALPAPQAASPSRTAPDDEALADQLNRALVEQAWRAGVDLT
jgi:hypothetical protein